MKNLNKKSIFKYAYKPDTLDFKVVTPARFERATFGLGIRKKAIS
jgi:hypothetical protein